MFLIILCIRMGNITCNSSVQSLLLLNKFLGFIVAIAKRTEYRRASVPLESPYRSFNSDESDIRSVFFFVSIGIPSAMNKSDSGRV